MLLTDVEGVLDEQEQRIPLFTKDQAIGQVTSSGPRVGTGGIHSKLDAAHKAARARARTS